MESLQPNAQIRSIMEPATPNTPINVRSLFLRMSRIFHWATNPMALQAAVRSNVDGFIFLGALGRSVCAGIPLSSFLQAR